MSTNLLVEKAKSRLHEDQYVKQVTKLVDGDPDALAAVEIVLLELALADLDRHSAAIKKEYSAYRKSHIKKYYRALTKTVLYEVAKHEGGDDGDDPHASGSPQSVHAGGKGKLKSAFSVSDETKQKVGMTSAIAALSAESLAESIVNTTEKLTEPAVAFLKESSLTKGALAVADYFVNKGNTVLYFAKAVKEYGPFVGMRMLNAYFRYGGYDVPIEGGKNEFGEKVEEGTQAQTREWAINNLKKRLPGTNVRESGAEPPSEGYVIGKNGKVIAHGVGRGNDHWLPFSSRHLRKMRKEGGGAEYVRRRMTGGITVEDLHAAMMMGVKKVTVVSNSGTFSVDLTGRSHGIRLEHGQVLDRFRELLDKNKRKGFKEYQDALDTLQAEFPLHFRTSAKEGKQDWLTVDDTIGPKKKLRDEFKELFKFGEEGDDDADDAVANATLPTGTGVRVADLGIKGWKKDDTFTTWTSRMREQFPNLSTADLYEHAKQRYQSKGIPVPDFVEARLKAAQNSAVSGDDSPSSGSSSSSSSGGPRTRTQERAEAAEIKPGKETPAEWKNDFQRGYGRMKSRGYDVDNIGDNPHAKKVLEIANELTQPQWKHVQSNPDDFHLGTDDWEAIAIDLDLVRQYGGGIG